MYKRAGADKGIVPLSYRRRDHARALPFAERAVASAQASEQHPQQQRKVRPCSAIRRMYERAGADKGIVPLACRKREYARALPFAERAGVSAQASVQHPQQQRENARALQFSECATVSAADVFDRPLRFRNTRREGKTNTPSPFVLESPIYKSFRRKKPAPALHTAVYHTRRKRRLTAAVRLSEQQAQPCLTGV